MAASERSQSSAQTLPGVAFRVVALAYVLAVLAAIGVQDHLGALPQGLFNEGRDGYALASHLCLVVGGALAGIFVLEFGRGRELTPGRIGRGVLVSFLLLEGLLFGVDATLMSGNPVARIGGPYQERVTREGAPVFVHKSHPASSLGFRTRDAHVLDPGHPRILFLGDSYTEGSGRQLACNYPEVVERELGSRLGRKLEVMNAGVGGYGPVDAWHLLELLVEEGYVFDALVYNLFLENDFTDNLPGTERRVVAGINFRFPRSRFLSWLHPLNSRSFRFPLFLIRAGGAVRAEVAIVTREAGPCRLHGEPLAALDPHLRALVERRLEANQHRTRAYAGTHLVEQALRGMQRIANEQGVPFVLVVFPDRILVDEVLQERIGFAERRAEYDLWRLHGWVTRSFPDLPQIDVTPLLRGATELYRARDTHLNDLGNVRSGEYVAPRLAPLLF